MTRSYTCYTFLAGITIKLQSATIDMIVDTIDIKKWLVFIEKRGKIVKETFTTFEGVNRVNRLPTKGKKILLTTDKTRKNDRLVTSKSTDIYRQPTKVENLTDNRQSSEILTDNRHVDPPFRPSHLRAKSFNGWQSVYYNTKISRISSRQ